MAIKVRPYKVGDLWKLNGRLIKGSRNTRFWEYKISKDNSMSMLVGGEIEACLGCAYNGPTVELWSAPSRRLLRLHLREYCTLVKKMLKPLKERLIPVTVHADTSDTHTLRWLGWLGFEDKGERCSWDGTEISILRFHEHISVRGSRGD